MGVAIALFAIPAVAAEAPNADERLFETLEAIDQMSLADLLQTQTKVASVTPLSQRSSPGILSIIGREEIVASGARDLIDVLRLVPGFAFGVDNQGVVGVGFRGNWGHEGKVLLQVDGHELNEGLYLTTEFGSHFPTDQIQRVEIVRGPGSAVYGGYAELAVINVVTRHAEQLEGPAVSVRFGQTAEGWARRTVSLAYGQTIPQLDGLKVSASGYLGQARRSFGDFQDFAGASFSMRDSEGFEPGMLNLNASWRGLELSYLYDNYQLLDQTGMGEVFPIPVRVGFTGHYLLASYELKLGHGLKLQPKFRYKRQLPWRVTEPDALVGEDNRYDRTFDRVEGSLTASWAVLDGLDLTAGVQAQLDRAWENDAPDETEVGYRNLALFGQAIYTNPIANLIAGARWENHSVVGSSFVPRAGVTKVLGDLHLKALYSRAFKAPGVANIELNEAIRPERTQVIELEAGYLFGPNLYAAVNVFDISIDDPIVYGYDPETEEESYLNFPRTGTAGVEALLKYKHARGFANLGYSFNYAGKNEVQVYTVPGDDRVMLGLPQHKVTASGSVEVLPRVSIAPSVVFLSKRHGFAQVDGDGAPQVGTRPAAWLVDLFVTWRPEQAQGLSLGAGVHNLLGERFEYLQPYDGGTAPLADLPREFAVRLAYEP